LDFVRWFIELPGAMELADRLCREIDKSATSVVLNVAEGNGRYSELDQRFSPRGGRAKTGRRGATLEGLDWLFGSGVAPRRAAFPDHYPVG